MQIPDKKKLAARSERADEEMARANMYRYDLNSPLPNEGEIHKEYMDMISVKTALSGYEKALWELEYVMRIKKYVEQE